MNEHELHRLLDEAAQGFTPSPSVGRLSVLLAAPRTAGRRLPVILGVAAGLAAVAGGAAALTADQYAGWSPNDQSVEVVVPDKFPVPGDDDAEVAPSIDDRAEEREAEERAAAEREAKRRAAAEREAERRARREALELRKSITTIPPTHDEPDPKPEPPPTTGAPKPEPPPTTEAPKPEPEPEPDPEPEPPPPTTTVPPEEEPPPTTEAPVEFSANQVHGSCSENPPYDVFHGTASPGTAIWIESPYGGAVTEAGAGGHWEKKVFFETAPYDEPFTVVVESETGGRKEFTFVRTG